jgi:phage terminase small subunit
MNRDKTVDKSLPKLTRKQAMFVKELIENPKQSATKAVLKTYNVNNAKTASVVATENLAKPSIQSHLHNASELVEQALEDTVRDWAKEENASKRALAMDTAKFIHDKVHGKATQKIQTENSNVNITIALG